MTVACSNSLKSASLISSLHFSFSVNFGYLESFVSPYKLKKFVFGSSSVRNVIGNLKGIALNLSKLYGFASTHVWM